MNAFAKGHVVVLGPDEGSPPPALPVTRPTRRRGEAIPIAARLASLGIKVLEPNAHIRRHAHERQHEALFCCAARAGRRWTASATRGGRRPSC